MDWDSSFGIYSEQRRQRDGRKSASRRTNCRRASRRSGPVSRLPDDSQAPGDAMVSVTYLARLHGQERTSLRGSALAYSRDCGRVAAARPVDAQSCYRVSGALGGHELLSVGIGSVTCRTSQMGGSGMNTADLDGPRSRSFAQSLETGGNVEQLLVDCALS